MLDHAKPLPENNAFDSASLGIAVLRTVQALLPEAAGEVEKASQDISRHLINLAEQAQKQRLMLQQLMTAIEDKGIKALIAQCAEAAEPISEAVSGMIVTMQFQDRNTQIMQNAAHILNKYQPMMDYFHKPSDVAATYDAMEAILADIRINTLRRHFVEELMQAGLPYAPKDALPEPDFLPIELF